MNFSQLGPFLNRRAKDIEEYYKSRHGATVTQLRDFTKKLGATQQEATSLRIRISSDYIALVLFFLSVFYLKVASVLHERFVNITRARTKKAYFTKRHARFWQNRAARACERSLLL
jgi:hypothetical protein